jgi:hypothetical protein
LIAHESSYLRADEELVEPFVNQNKDFSIPIKQGEVDDEQ